MVEKCNKRTITKKIGIKCTNDVRPIGSVHNLTSVVVLIYVLVKFNDLVW